ncbi:amidoligase family protein [Mesobaculum littorinae]|nr:amidoligase family protein [Mesobaculum littorinae]
MDAPHLPDLPPVALLPHPQDAEGNPRRVGVEVECGGLTEERLAGIATQVLGGSARRTAGYEFAVTDTSIGDLQVMLDTALKDHAQTELVRRGLDMGRGVIPVEFVTDPILPTDLVHVDAFCRALRAAGATGTRDGAFLGFGVHLNVTAAGLGVDGVLPTLRAFALMEAWLRRADPIDASRRILPFVDPYPARFVDALAAPDAAGWDMKSLIDTYLRLTPSRNRGLDMLPLIRHLAPDRVQNEVDGASSIKARPAYHYRLPDCRIDDPDWSVTREWNRWVRVERVAADPAALDALADGWRKYRSRRLPFGRGNWALTVSDILGIPQGLTAS